MQTKPHTITGERKQEYLDFFNRILGCQRYLTEVKMITHLDAEGKPMAVVVFSNCNGSNMEIAIAAKQGWSTTKSFLIECFYYAFVTCGVKRISSVVDERNTKALSFDLRLGFKKEFKEPLKDFFGDSDGYLLVMHREDCKWIRNLL